MSDEPKDLRIPIMMSASEVKAIDDWSFRNRIRTRAEAIRRLCYVGLSFTGAEADKIRTDIALHRKSVLMTYDALRNSYISEEKPDEKKVLYALRSLIDTMIDLEDNVRSYFMKRHLLHLSETFEDAQDTLSKTLEEIENIIIEERDGVLVKGKRDTDKK